MRTPPARRSVAATVALGSLLIVSGCGSSSPDAQPTATAPSTTAAAPSPTAPADTSAADEAAIRATYDKFWDAAVRVEGGDPQREAFDGIAEGDIVEDEVAAGASYKKQGIALAGQPKVTDVHVAISGDDAVVSACVDYTDWKPKGVEPTTGPVLPVGVTFVRAADAWLATEWTDVTPGVVTC